MEVYIPMTTSNMQKSEDLPSSVIFHPDAMQREEEDTGLLGRNRGLTAVVYSSGTSSCIGAMSESQLTMSNGEAARWRVRTKKGQVPL